MYNTFRHSELNTEHSPDHLVFGRPALDWLAVWFWLIIVLFLTSLHLQVGTFHPLSLCFVLNKVLWAEQGTRRYERSRQPRRGTLFCSTVTKAEFPAAAAAAVLGHRAHCNKDPTTTMSCRKGDNKFHVRRWFCAFRSQEQCLQVLRYGFANSMGSAAFYVGE